MRCCSNNTVIRARICATSSGAAGYMLRPYPIWRDVDTPCRRRRYATTHAASRVSVTTSSGKIVMSTTQRFASSGVIAWAIGETTHSDDASGSRSIQWSTGARGCSTNSRYSPSRANCQFRTRW